MRPSLLRTLAVQGCHGVGVLTLAERFQRDCLTVLTYHRVLPTDRRQRYFNPGLVVTPDALKSHCRLLSERFEVLPLGQAVDRWSHGSVTGRPLAAITFDDGYRDNFRLAVPALTECGLRATFFIVAGLVGASQPPWYDRLARAIELLLANRSAHEPPTADSLRLVMAPAGSGQRWLSPAAAIAAAKTLQPAARKALIERVEAHSGTSAAWMDDDLIMDWPQLRELAAAGHEIGSHGRSHEILPALDDAASEEEVAGSRRLLEQGLSRPVRSFCYPNGDVNDRVASAVESAGYTCAVGTVSGPNVVGQDRFRLCRRFIHEDRLNGNTESKSALLLRAELCGLADRMFGRGLRGRRRL